MRSVYPVNLFLRLFFSLYLDDSWLDHDLVCVSAVVMLTLPLPVTPLIDTPCTLSGISLFYFEYINESRFQSAKMSVEKAEDHPMDHPSISPS